MIYYYELPFFFGNFEAADDEEALVKMPKGCMILYKESDTEDGTPFIVLYEQEEE